MTFAAIEETRSLGEPNTLFRFTIGTNVYAYTDSEDEITFASVTYQPIPIDPDPINTSGTLDKSTLNVRMPRDTPVADLFRAFPPSEVVGLTIFQGHAGDAEYLAIWAGRVLSFKWEDSEAVAECEPVSTSMKRAGLRIRDQYQCMHALYGPSCKVNRAAFTVNATVLTISNGRVTFADGWNGDMPESRFANGIIQWVNDGRSEQRQILKVSAANNRLQIAGILTGLAAGMTVALSRGCSHNMDNCNEFANILNFGGAPFIPKTNPLAFVNNFG